MLAHFTHSYKRKIVMNEPKAAKYLRVVDSSVNELYPKREHEIEIRNEWITVVFQLGEDTILPFEQGAKFFTMDGFDVFDVDGGFELEVPPTASDGVVSQIGKDQCVANYTELRTDALRLRAAHRSGGEIYLDADDDSRPDIISFLIGEVPTDEAEELVDPEEEEAAEDEIDLDQADPADEIEKINAQIVFHFTEGLHHGRIEFFEANENDVAVFDVLGSIEEGAESGVVVRGTFLELHAAVLDGVSADRYNSDRDAQADVPEIAEFDTEKYGGTFVEVINALMAKFGAVAYEGDPESGVYRLLYAEDSPASHIEGTLDDLIAAEAVNSDAPETAAEPISGAPENGGDGSTEDIAGPEADAEDLAAEAGNEPSSEASGTEASPDTEAPAESPAPADTEVVSTSDDEPTFTLEEIKASTDEALEIAVQYGIDILTVKGSGTEGNVLKPDVLKHIEDNNLQPVQTEAAE